ncbi:MAG: hypothetical protein M3Q19_06260 [Pseudomonadota bacterium]|nr:hypothetical protein [Pseudomonadota bacterium]
MLGRLRTLVLVELAEDRANQIAGSPLSYILGDRDKLHLGLGELAAIALELELVPEEAAEAVDDHEIIGTLARGCGFNHGLELGPIVVGRGCARLTIHVDQQHAARLTIGRYRSDLIDQARLMLSLSAGRDADIGGGPWGHLRQSRGTCWER